MSRAPYKRPCSPHDSSSPDLLSQQGRGCCAAFLQAPPKSFSRLLWGNRFGHGEMRVTRNSNLYSQICSLSLVLSSVLAEWCRRRKKVWEMDGFHSDSEFSNNGQIFISKKSGLFPNPSLSYINGQKWPFQMDISRWFPWGFSFENATVEEHQLRILAISLLLQGLEVFRKKDKTTHSHQRSNCLPGVGFWDLYSSGGCLSFSRFVRFSLSFH